MNWSALTKKQKQMVVATVILAVVQVVLLAHFLGWTKPASARGGSEKDELLDLQGKLDDARVFLRQQDAIGRDLLESVQKLEALTRYTPALSDRYAWTYEYVSRCATQSHIELDSLEEVLYLDGKNKKTDPSQQPYEIRVSTLCGYNSLVEFLWRLENGNPLLRIKEIRVSTLRDNPRDQQVRILMQWPATVQIEGREQLTPDT
ncbi:MAG: hypothetical protein AB7E95_09780 [Kiritimatiellales bacterium]